jgi:hypothetical protein
MANPISYIIQGARRRGLDPNAVLAVAKQEGLSGGIGDYGTSFGPWQLHIGGALPSAVGARGAGYAQRWAWSPAGINYALDQMAHVARGQRGRAAVTSIVSRFERPAAPGREIAGALGAYGSAIGAGRPLAIGATRPQQRFGGRRLASAGIGAPTQPRQPIDLTGLVNLTNQIVGLPASSVPITIPGSAPAQPAARRVTPGRARPVTSPAPVARAPRRGGRSIGYLEHFAAPYGLTVTSTTGGKHVKNSYHYRGRAVDFSGSSSSMMALMRQALKHPEQFVEAFYDPAGVYVKNGKVYKGSIGGHTDHVHLAR